MMRLTFVASLAALPALSALTAQSPSEQRVVTISVLDRTSKQPLAGADVTELLSGATGQSSENGTIRFAAHRRQSLTIIAKKVGFAPESITVASGTSDTSHATIFLSPMTRLATEIVTAAAPSRYDAKLEMAGFFSRRQSAAAAQSSFVTADDILGWKATKMTDLSRRTGKPLGNCTAYHDGLEWLPIPSRAPRQLRPGLDAAVQVQAVAALEVYRAQEAPVAYPARGRDPCVLLLWFK